MLLLDFPSIKSHHAKPIVSTSHNGPLINCGSSSMDSVKKNNLKFSQKKFLPRTYKTSSKIPGNLGTGKIGHFYLLIWSGGPWLGIVCRLWHTPWGIGSGLAWNPVDLILMTFEMDRPVFNYQYNQGIAGHIKMIYQTADLSNLAPSAGPIFGHDR